jgi:single-strand DNA-binding protein
MVNKTILLGRVGKDPVIKHFTNSSIAEFSMATDDSYKNKAGEKIEQTDWHNIKVNGKLAEVAEKYIRKGSLLYVEGKIKTRSYDDKDGNKKYVTEIVAESFKMLDKKPMNETAAAQTSSAPSSTSAADDDLPF